MDNSVRPGIVTVNEAAAIAKVERRTITNWIGKGALAAKRLPGGQYRIKTDDLMVLLGVRQ